MEIRSIWDGWDKQCLYRLGDKEEGFCARGWALVTRGTEPRKTYRRVAAFIRANYDLPAVHIHETCGRRMRPRRVDRDTIAYANNVLGLTPEDFRRIDRETQVEAVVRPLVETIEAQRAVKAAPQSESVTV